MTDNVHVQVVETLHRNKTKKRDRRHRIFGVLISAMSHFLCSSELGHLTGPEDLKEADQQTEKEDMDATLKT